MDQFMSGTWKTDELFHRETIRRYNIGEGGLRWSRDSNPVLTLIHFFYYFSLFGSWCLQESRLSLLSHHSPSLICKHLFVLQYLLEETAVYIFSVIMRFFSLPFCMKINPPIILCMSFNVRAFSASAVSAGVQLSPVSTSLPTRGAGKINGSAKKWPYWSWRQRGFQKMSVNADDEANLSAELKWQCRFRVPDRAWQMRLFSKRAEAGSSVLLSPDLITSFCMHGNPSSNQTKCSCCIIMMGCTVDQTFFKLTIWPP